MLMKMFLLAAFSFAAAAQPVGFGIKFGIPLNDALQTPTQPGNTLQYAAENGRFAVGPYIEVRLPAGLSIEGDAIYRTNQYQAIGPSAQAFGQTPVTSWEFPVLAKVRFGGAVIRPFIGAGLAFGRITDVVRLAEVASRNNFGIVAAGGIEFKLGPVRLGPELRYYGWTKQNFQHPQDLIQTNRNQTAVMLNFGF